MKLKILTLIALMFSLNVYAQNKGKNALSLGISIINEHLEGISVNTNKVKSHAFSFGYGTFIGDHDKIGIELRYGTSKDEFISKSESDGSEMIGESYGGSLSYQRYHPLLKTLHVHTGVNAGYDHNTSIYNEFYQYPRSRNDIQKRYSVGVFGGVTWFLSKSFAFEVNIISLNTTYSTSFNTEETSDGYVYKNGKSSNFNLTTQGLINNLGFKVFLLF